MDDKFEIWKEAWRATPRWMRVLFIYSYIVAIALTLLIMGGLVKYIIS